MHFIRRAARAAVALSSILIAIVAHAQARQVVSFDPNWLFVQADPVHAEQPTFDDTQWRPVGTPHDASIAGPIAQKNPSGQGGGFFPTGIVWYRKSFHLSTTNRHRHTFIVFDGIMANSDVWINGFHLGKRPNGTVSFYYELTGHLNFGPMASNVLAVRCDTSQQPASRWYEGEGIYRHVRLVMLNDVHLAPWSTVISTTGVSKDNVTVNVRSTVTNDSATPAKVALKLQLKLPDGAAYKAGTSLSSKTVTVSPHTSSDISMSFRLPRPELWDIDHPALQSLNVNLQANHKIIDDDTVSFGIREFHFDADTGFWFNGRNLKLKGAALHIDGGAVGIAVPLAVYESRLLALRALGVNAIRTAHNPPSPEFLDLCDRLGFLVMEEMFDAWTIAKNPYDYHLYFRQWAMRDLKDTVMRDRNHPSIVLWSAGNEIHDTPNAELAKGILSDLVAGFHENDPTRPVTQALFRPNASHDYDDGLADILDVVGQNYRENELLAAHAQKPSRKILGTENTHDRNQWLAMRDHPAYAGQFIWTGVDYLGEAGEGGGWPLFCNGDGLLDRTLVPRARAFQRQSWWSETPNIHVVRRTGVNDKIATDPGYEDLPKSRQVLFHDWSPANRGAHTESLEVYTNADEAELLLNGRSLGRQRLHADASPLIWQVPFEPGTLTSVGYSLGKEVARDELRTAGPAASIRLLADRSAISTKSDDVLAIRAEIADAQGTLVPDASNLITFSVFGGQILAVDSGSNTDHDPFLSDHRHAFQGRALLMVKSKPAGTITVRATTDGLVPIVLTAKLNVAHTASIQRSF